METTPNNEALPIDLGPYHLIEGLRQLYEEGETVPAVGIDRELMLGV